MRLIRARVLFVIVLAAALLVAGWDFSRFVARADRAVTPDPPFNAEAVTALTGAADARIITAIQLADSLDLPLLISGVNVDTTPADIARVTNTSTRPDRVLRHARQGGRHDRRQWRGSRRLGAPQQGRRASSS